MMDMEIHSTRRGFILVEIMMVLVLVAVLLPVIYGFVFREVSKETRQMGVEDEAEQVLFVQNTLQRLRSESSQIDVLPDHLVFTSSRDVTIVRLKNKQIAQDNGVVRYLTMLPVEVRGFGIEPETANRIHLSLQTQ